MKIKSLIIGLIAATAIFVACDDKTSTIGSSIVEDKITITVDSTFTVAGQTVANNAVQSRTLLQLIGRIDAEGYGSLSSDVVTQFMPAVALDTTGVTVADIDSLKLMMAVFHGAFVGDSVSPMGIEIYRLNRALPSPIFSDFDPADYYNPSDKLGSIIYNASTMGDSDSLKNADYHTISVDLPVALGRELFTAYKKTPANFQTPAAFINNVFKGIYMRNSFGSGRLTLVSSTILRTFYHTTVKTDDGRDSIVRKQANYFAVTPEVVSNNNIGLRVADNISSLVNAGDNIIMSPTGYDVEFTFPITDIIRAYKESADRKGIESAINNLTFYVPADSVENRFGFGPAPYLLMVLKNKKEEFFRNSDLPDQVTSFYANYDSDNGRYSFGSLRDYVIKMINKEDLNADDYTFVLTPVSLETETSSDYYYGTTSTVTAVTPYISRPTITKILLDQAKIKFTYSSRVDGI